MRRVVLAVAVGCGWAPDPQVGPPPDVKPLQADPWTPPARPPDGPPMVVHQDLTWTARPGAWPPPLDAAKGPAKRCAVRATVSPDGSVRPGEVRACDPALHDRARATVSGWRADPTSLPRPGDPVQTVIPVAIHASDP